MKCFNCNHEVIWNSTFPQNEIDMDIDKDDSSVVNYYTCPHCGCSYEVYEPLDSEKENYEFWQTNR